MDDQAPRGQVPKLAETEARRRIPPACHRFARSAQEGHASRCGDRKGPVRRTAWPVLQQEYTGTGPRTGSDRR